MSQPSVALPAAATFGVAHARPSVPRHVSAALTAITLVAVSLALGVAPRQAALFLVGVAAGVVLYHAAFGFTSAWRVFIADGRGAGVRAQMLMLAVTSLVFLPLLAAGELFGQPMRGSTSPVGVSVLLGAFIFGIGMQLGGGCASGTLYSAGGGSTRMLVVLFFFITGSVLATAHASWWTNLPAFAPVSIVTSYGAVAALAISLSLFAAITALTFMVERRRPAAVAAGRVTVPPVQNRWWRGPWPLVAGALGLAAVNIATLTIAGRPWGVTSAFALWGAKALAAMGVPVESWTYWSTPAQTAALSASVWADVTTVMNVGIILGALAASMAAGRFAPVWRVPVRSLVAAVIGGILLGYGARLAYGCNIGAYFSGIASGSLHGWVWLVAAFGGNIVGVRFRPFFGLSVERSSRQTAHV